MIALLRSTDGNPDSRFQKYIWFLEQNNIPFYSICWDRNLKMTDTESKKFFHKKAYYGEGIKNIFGLIKFNCFLSTELFKNRKKISIIHAADFDTVIPAILMKFFFGKKVIYDIYDWYIDSRCIKNKFLKSIIKYIEFINIKLADRVIICEPERESQIIFKTKKLWILPNIPNFQHQVPKNDSTYELSISYVGILGYERGLENLIKLSKETPSVKLTIAGFGPLSSLLKDSNNYSNITYLGTVPYDKSLEIMSNSDIIYACYETTNPNHVLAAPNKYYEGLYLGKPIITTEGTIVGDKTKKYNTGYVIKERYEDLKELIQSINYNDLKKKGINAERLWNEKYRFYVADFLTKTYLPFIVDN